MSYDLWIIKRIWSKILRHAADPGDRNSIELDRVSSNRGRETGEACFLGGIGGAQKRERRSLNNYF